MKVGLRALALVLICAPTIALGASWWNGDWKFRKEVVLDLSPAGADVSGSPTDVPVLLRLSVANFAYFADTKPDGSDFRVVAGDDKTPLKFHLERYDPQNQMAFVWVRVPRLTGGAKSDRFYLYYGNPDAPPAGDVAGTYDADQAVAMHFGGDGLPADSTAYKNNASSADAQAVPASFAGAGLRFSGTSTVKVPASRSLQLSAAKGYTAAIWVKFDQPQSDATVLALSDAGGEFSIGIQGARAIARIAAGAAPVVATSATDLSLGQWHQLAATVLAGQLTLYVDGAAAGSVPVAATDIAASLTLGGAPKGGHGYTGELDELGISRIARSADWLKATAKGQGPDASLVSYGADGQKEGSQGSYFTTIARNLTVDGWVVIVICMLMLVTALGVMVMKALYLSTVERANSSFLEHFAKLKEDVTALRGDAPRKPLEAAAEEPAYSASTLYQIYSTGTDELFKRVLRGDRHPETTIALSPQAIEAIRASMDASLTRVQQRLSARMVLLTIAISGGPFLGLLGTVIGVMITFAAIAASGDVNVNAIAPGTAAALAATVAGLAVAIPSLFGYNWLNSRIKTIGSENRVFADEFIARLAEQYA